MKKSEKQEQNQGEVEDEGADRKYQVFRRNTFDRHLIEVMMLLVWLLWFNMKSTVTGVSVNEG